ncbi:MAG: hypothetical protein OHK0029_33660 [Armatimonadaceae bacterium]
MPRVIVLDTFPLSCTGKRDTSTPNPSGVSDQCRRWIFQCISAGNPVFDPCIAYYEAVRELERLNARAQIARRALAVNSAGFLK